MYTALHITIGFFAGLILGALLGNCDGIVDGRQTVWHLVHQKVL